MSTDEPGMERGSGHSVSGPGGAPPPTMRRGLPSRGVVVGVAVSAALVLGLAGFSWWNRSDGPTNGAGASGDSGPMATADQGSRGSVPPGATRTDVPDRIYTTAEFPDLGATGSVSRDDPELGLDVRRLERATGSPWTPEMLTALGASYCEGWPSEPDQDAYEISAKGQRQWAASVAPRLGISYDEALVAILTSIPERYRTCS